MLEVSAWGHGEAFTPLFLETELGVSPDDVPRWTGFLAAAPLAVAVPFAPFWGVLADRYNRKLIILRSLFVAAIAYGLVALSQDVWQFLAIRFLLGLTFGGNAIVIATIASVAPERRMGLAIGILQMTFPVGKSVGPLFGSLLISLFGLRGMFAVDALMAFVGFLLVLFLFEDPPRRRDTSLGILSRLGAVARVVWKTQPIRLNFLLFSLFAGGMWLLSPYLPVKIGEVYDGPDLAFVIGLILAGYGALAGLAAPFAGRLADWMGPTRMVTLNMLGLTIMSAGLLVAASPLQVAMVVLFGAIPFGASNTALYAHLARHTPRDHMSAVMSLTPLARNTAMLVGPLIGAGVSGLGLGAVFVAAAAINAVAVGVSVMMEKASSEVQMREER